MDAHGYRGPKCRCSRISARTIRLIFADKNGYNRIKIFCFKIFICILTNALLQLETLIIHQCKYKRNTYINSLCNSPNPFCIVVQEEYICHQLANAYLLARSVSMPRSWLCMLQVLENNVLEACSSSKESLPTFHRWCTF